MTKRKTTTPTDSRAFLDSQVAEKDLQKAVVTLAKRLGFKCHHVYDSRLASANVDKGFPDWVFAKDGRVLFVELKTVRGKLSSAQADWLYELSARNRVECYVWRTKDWTSGRIEQVLTGVAMNAEQQQQKRSA